ncbi:spiro-SPASM protein [Treponema sp. HNW]|uniref:spiro-SPASM protein n=1 Tax=Treponema sp. HNW TaxID=3116654 RepID=UPI003D0E9301
MKPFVFLIEAGLRSFADEKLFAGKSAREKAELWAAETQDSCGTDCIKTPVSLPSLLKHMCGQLSARNADTAVLAFADCPFLNAALTAEMLDLHKKYRAEYTFADGYPYGFTPEIIDAGTLKILLKLAESKEDFTQGDVKPDSLFSLIKTDINSFEIETLIAPRDYRYLRLNFSCSSKRDTLACRRLFNLLPDCTEAALLCEKARSTAEIQRTLPAFYNIQICSSEGGESMYEPAVTTSALPASMELASFNTLLKKISDFSDDAVISLSFLGEPLRHPDFVLFAEAVASYKNLSLLIETDGQNLDEQTAVRIQKAFSAHRPGSGVDAPVNWIVKLDACDEQTYKTVRKKGSLEAAEKTAALLKTLFPGAVYPQMVRMKANEHQLEAFFRRWKAEGELIIQKYDYISGLLEDLRPADLSPAVRTPCWHIKRDMCILADGSVPRCKTAVFFSEPSYGNVFTEELETVWARGAEKLKEQLQGLYTGTCEKSDEYYTFNF